MRLIPDHTNIDFIGSARTFAMLSLGAVVTAVLSLIFIGLNFGIDFLGGYEIQLRFSQPTTESKIRDVLKPVDLEDVRVQRLGGEGSNEFLLLAREHTEKLNQELQALRIDLAQMAGGEEHLARWSVNESGDEIRVEFTEATAADKVSEVAKRHPINLQRIEHEDREDVTEFRLVLTPAADRIKSTLSAGFPGEEQLVQRMEFVGPTVGAQLRNQGLSALFYALLFIMIYIALRFDFYFAPGAIAALLHDVAVVIGAATLMRLEFNLPSVAAVLTIVGYSNNDTIVIYDRVRENKTRMLGSDLRKQVNVSVNQTLNRSILTHVTTFLASLSLVIFGGPALRDFSIIMTIGVVVGAYSSIYIASPIYIWLHEIMQRRAQAVPARQSK